MKHLKHTSKVNVSRAADAASPMLFNKLVCSLMPDKPKCQD